MQSRFKSTYLTSPPPPLSYYARELRIAWTPKEQSYWVSEGFVVPVTNFMQQSPSSEADSHLASQ
jgi:hypothetical protein